MPINDLTGEFRWTRSTPEPLSRRLAGFWASWMWPLELTRYSKLKSEASRRLILTQLRRAETPLAARSNAV